MKSIAELIKRLPEGESLRLDSGRAYVGGVVYGRKAPLRIIGNGAEIIGTPKFERCGPLSIENLICSGNAGPGIFIVQCESVRLSGLKCHENDGSGILTANTSNVSIDTCRCNSNKDAHGIYVSQSGDHIRVTRNTCRNNGRCGIQVNAVQPRRKPSDPLQDSITHDFVISDNTLQRNQRQGRAAAINLAGCRDGLIEGNRILNHEGRHGIALWDDGTREETLACHDIVIRGNRFSFDGDYGAYNVSIGRGCSGIVIEKGNKFDPTIRGVQQ